jgi:hypothetical protein
MIYDNIIKSQFPKDAGLGHQKQYLGSFSGTWTQRSGKDGTESTCWFPKLELENQQKYRLWPIKVK